MDPSVDDYDSNDDIHKPGPSQAPPSRPAPPSSGPPPPPPPPPNSGRPPPPRLGPIEGSGSSGKSSYTDDDSDYTDESDLDFGIRRGRGDGRRSSYYSDDEDLDIRIHRGRTSSYDRVRPRSPAYEDDVDIRIDRERRNSYDRVRPRHPDYGFGHEQARYRLGAGDRVPVPEIFSDSPTFDRLRGPRAPPRPPPVFYPANPFSPQPIIIENHRATHFNSPLVPALDIDGNPLTLDVLLIDEKGPGWNDNRTESTSLAPKIVHIETSRCFMDEADVEKVILNQPSSGDAAKTTNFRWIHLQQNSMSMKSLEDLVTQTPDLNSDDKLIAKKLIRQVAAKVEKPYVHGHHLKAIILRGDSHDLGKTKSRQPDRHCTFINFPFFLCQEPPSIPQQQKLHIPLGLLQNLHLLESTKLRDREQAICKLKSLNRFIHVAQLWSIIIGSEVLITYSTKSFKKMCGENIEVPKPKLNDPSGPTVLRVKDPYDRVFFFPIEQCKTWFELEELVYSQCELGPRYDYDLFFKGKQPGNGAQWAKVLASEESTFVDIFIQFKEYPGPIEVPSLDSDDDYYLRGFPQHTRNVIYPRMRQSTRDSQYGRGASYHDLQRPQLGRRQSTRHTAREENDLRQRSSENRGKGPERIFSENQISRNDHRGGRRDQNYNNNMFLPMLQSEQPIVAEPDSYTANPEPKRRPKGDTMALVLYETQGALVPYDHSSPQNRPAEATSRNEDSNQLTSHQLIPRQRQLPPPPRDSTLTGDPQNTAIRSTPNSEPQRHDPHPANSYRGPKRRGTIEVRRNNGRMRYDQSRDEADIYRGDMRLEGTKGERDAYHDDNFPVDRKMPIYRRNRGRPSVDRVVSYTNQDEIEPDIYYVPKKEKPSIPTIKMNNDDNTTNAESKSKSKITEAEQSKAEPLRSRSKSFRRRSSGSQKERRSPSGSFRSSRIAPPVKPLPILWWPTGPMEDENIAGINNTRDNGFLDEKGIHELPSRSSKGPPRTTETANSNQQKERDDASLAEVLERIYNSLLTDRRGRHDKLFKEMETANQADALYKFSKPPPPPPPPPPPTNWKGDGARNFPFRRGPGPGPPQYPPPGPTGGPPPPPPPPPMGRRGEAKQDQNSRQQQQQQRQQQQKPVGMPPTAVPLSSRQSPGAAFLNAVPSSSRQQPAENLLNTPPWSSSTTPRKDLPEYENKLQQFSHTANELLKCFVPEGYPSPVIGRYYGAIKRIIKTVDEAQKHNFISKSIGNHSIAWIIEDIGTSEYNQKHHLRPLSFPLDSCSECRTKFAYKSELEASNHLLQVHFPPDRRPPIADTVLWVKKHQPLSDKRRCEEHLKVLKKCCTHLSLIHKRVQEICDGVCEIGIAHNPKYRLPKSLVIAFRKLTLVLIYASNVLQLITKRSDSWNSPHWKPRDDYHIEDKILIFQDICREVEENVDKGKFDLTVMVRTRDFTQSIKRYESVGPQYILTMILKNLQSGSECRELFQVYKEYVSRLSFQVSQYPRRRLLRSLQYFNEEIDAIQLTLAEQFNLQTDLMRVLDPYSFRKTTETRISQYDLERALLMKVKHKNSQEASQIEHMQQQVERLIEDNKTAIEINDDDHGKAILVFTIVTLVFLPLSFVASFLGMNTVDIRNQTTSQTLFWMVALPVTAAVVAFALVIGYKYETMKDYFEGWMRRLKK